MEKTDVHNQSIQVTEQSEQRQQKICHLEAVRFFEFLVSFATRLCFRYCQLLSDLILLSLGSIFVCISKFLHCFLTALRLALVNDQSSVFKFRIFLRVLKYKAGRVLLLRKC